MNQPLSYVHPAAKIAKTVVIEPFTTIGKDVVIGEGTWIGSNVTIMEGARIGKNCSIYPGAVISGVPQDLKFKGEETTAEIGDNTVIRECVTINRGTNWRKKTKIGKNCLIMAYSHIAHDCKVGDNCIFSNNSTLAGHVTVGDYVTLAGMVAVHQFCNIGAYSFSAMGSAVSKDIPAFVRVSGNTAKARGLNVTGISRLNINKEGTHALKEAYKIIYLRKNTLENSKKEIEANFGHLPEIKTLLNSLKNSKRGIVR